MQPAERLTAGIELADGRVAVACYMHIYTKAAWLLGWAECSIEQQNISDVRGRVIANGKSNSIVERRVGLNASQQAADIARHLQIRQDIGPTFIITDRPSIYLSMVRKNWMKLERILQRERASTLDKSLKAELTRQIEHMKSLRFVARGQEMYANADVMFITPELALALSKQGRTVYVCTPMHHTGLMPEQFVQDGGVLVDYMCNTI